MKARDEFFREMQTLRSDAKQDEIDQSIAIIRTRAAARSTPARERPICRAAPGPRSCSADRHPSLNTRTGALPAGCRLGCVRPVSMKLR
jgi:hypothetical protein